MVQLANEALQSMNLVISINPIYTIMNSIVQINHPKEASMPQASIVTILGILEIMQWFLYKVARWKCALEYTSL